MKDTQARKAIKLICGRFGISYSDDWMGGGIKIGEYTMIQGGDLNLLPVTREGLATALDWNKKCTDRAISQLTETIKEQDDTIKMLLKYLKLQIVEGKRIEPVKKGK